MRYGARMTVRSSPSSKHVPQKERRYHVKIKMATLCMNRELFTIMVPVLGYTNKTFSLTCQAGIYIITAVTGK